MNPDEIIMKAARELGIQQYVSISPWRETNTVVLVSVEPGMFQVVRRLPYPAYPTW